MSNGKTRLNILILAFTLALFLIPPALALKPLRGTMDLTWNNAWSGPGLAVPDWTGFVTINGAVYNMAFYNLGTGKTYDSNPGKVGHFGEVWVISDGVYTPGDNSNVVLMGTDVGAWAFANAIYRMNGEVMLTNIAFAAYMGHQVHMSGIINLDPNGVPLSAPGEFTIN